MLKPYNFYSLSQTTRGIIGRRIPETQGGFFIEDVVRIL